jgi:hypothetical protein
VIRTLGLRDVRERGRLTKKKRAALQELHASLGELAAELRRLHEPDHADDLRSELERFRRLTERT